MVPLGTGMRVSELVGLNLSDYDLTTPGQPYVSNSNLLMKTTMRRFENSDFIMA